MIETKIIDVNEDNITECPPKCFMNPKNEGYKKKVLWLKKQFKQGLKIKLIYKVKENKCIGFIEYIPGENAWRAVESPDYLFIHCIWISPNIYKNLGHGSLLVNECLMDAKKGKKSGVAVVTSEGSFMAGKDLFIKNGFKSIQHEEPSYELLIKKIKTSKLPKFKNWKNQLNNYNGWNVLYSYQCPWVVRSINDIVKISKKYRLELKLIELKSAEDAQNAPSIYSTFNLIYNGRLLADHYISSRRFENILKKELK